MYKNTNNITNLFTSAELKMLKNTIEILNNMIQNENTLTSNFTSILMSLFHMHFNRLIGIDRWTENIMNSNIENILHAIHNLKKRN